MRSRRADIFGSRWFGPRQWALYHAKARVMERFGRDDGSLERDPQAMVPRVIHDPGIEIDSIEPRVECRDQFDLKPLGFRLAVVAVRIKRAGNPVFQVDAHALSRPAPIDERAGRSDRLTDRKSVV